MYLNTGQTFENSIWDMQFSKISNKIVNVNVLQF